MALRKYWSSACPRCPIKAQCSTSDYRRITRWEPEHVLEAVQRRLDEHPEKVRQRCETVEHTFGTIKARMGATHFLMKRLPRVAIEMALHVLAYNLTRVTNILGPRGSSRRCKRRSQARRSLSSEASSAPRRRGTPMPSTLALGIPASATAFSHGQDPKRTFLHQARMSVVELRPHPGKWGAS